MHLASFANDSRPPEQIAELARVFLLPTCGGRIWNCGPHGETVGRASLRSELSSSAPHGFDCEPGGYSTISVDFFALLYPQLRRPVLRTSILRKLAASVGMQLRDQRFRSVPDPITDKDLQSRLQRYGQRPSGGIDGK